MTTAQPPARPRRCPRRSIRRPGSHLHRPRRLPAAPAAAPQPHRQGDRRRQRRARRVQRHRRAAVAGRLRRPDARRRHRRHRLSAAVAAHAGRTTAAACARKPAAAPAGPRSPVPRVTIAALLIVVGVLALMTQASAAGTSAPAAFLGAELLVVGLGLVAAAFADGRTARGGLIALGVVLSLATHHRRVGPWRGGGERDRRRDLPRASTPIVRPSTTAASVTCTIDLSGVDAHSATPSHPRPGRRRATSGVIVPRSADVRVSVDPGIGDVRVFGRRRPNGGSSPAPARGPGRTTAKPRST